MPPAPTKLRPYDRIQIRLLLLLFIIIIFKPSLDIFLQWGLKLLFH